MKKINININEGHGCEEAKMHRTTLAHLIADAKVLLDMVQDTDDLPEWLETKITKAGDYMSSAARYIAGAVARDRGQLEEEMLEEQYICEVDVYHDLHEILQDAITEDGEMACPECLYEVMVDASCDCSEMLSEAEYRGRKVKLNKPMRGDVKKFKVFVKDPKTGNVKKVNFGHGGSSAKKKGEKTMRIRKSNPKARKNFRARHNCKNPGPKTKARYWSCRKW
tara:strand:+ start:6241 stop:6909 length:669 start_codon:yes stop_codon:yes gene_type:complete